MSGNRLRAMLENPEFCSSLSSFSNNVLNYNNGSSNFPNANVYNRYYNYSGTNVDSVKSSPNSSCDTQANRNSHRDSNLKANYIDYANTTGVVTATTTKTSSSDISSDVKKGKFDFTTPQPQASLLRGNVWDNVGLEGVDDFNLEYMNLDEFLTETGLVDTNFNGLVDVSAATPPPSQMSPLSSTSIQQSPVPVTDMPTPPQIGIERDSPRQLEQLLTKGSSGSLSVTSPVESVTVGSPLSSPPASVTSSHESFSSRPDSATPSSPVAEEVIKSVQLTASQVVKKRKYSEDGDGLTETSVVVVPGQDGFDPTIVKFAPEELQPQPIIKKSKKQFVPEESKDDKYWKRRNKNNVAAKRSREARRAKENQIIMRAGFLESEVEKLQTLNQEQKEEIEKLKNIIKNLEKNQNSNR